MKRLRTVLPVAIVVAVFGWALGSPGEKAATLRKDPLDKLLD